MFWNNSEFSRMFWNILACSRMLRNVPASSGMFQHLLECSRMFLECSRMFWIFPEWVCWVIPHIFEHYFLLHEERKQCIYTHSQNGKHLGTRSQWLNQECAKVWEIKTWLENVSFFFFFFFFFGGGEGLHFILIIYRQDFLSCEPVIHGPKTRSKMLVLVNMHFAFQYFFVALLDFKARTAVGAISLHSP